MCVEEINKQPFNWSDYDYFIEYDYWTFKRESLVISQ
jgi:hypothetical protein